MSDAVLYGITQCDQVRKARKWLAAHDIPHLFHDFRKDGLEQAHLDEWFRHVPWDALLNRRGRTWRLLDDSTRKAVVDQASAAELMLREPTLIKRPVLASGGHVLVGFSEAVYARTLGTPAP